jgi:cation diffusion facilitator family transporter
MASGSKLVIYAALIGNMLIAVTKFVAAGITGSSAMLSEGIHSLVDTGNQVLLLWGIRRSKRPPDDRYPFGHGKEIYFWSFVVAILIFAVGAGVSIFEGVHQIRAPEPIESAMVNYTVIGLALLFEGAAWYFAITQFSKVKGSAGYVEAVRRGKDPSVFVVLFEDSAAMLGLVIAFAGILLSETTGIVQFDGIASILIGLILAGTAIWLAYETKSLLIGESANRNVVAGIRQIALNHSAIDHVNEVLTMHMGPNFVLLNLSVAFSNEATAPEIELATEEIDARIKQEYPEVQRIFVEAEARRRRAEQRPG